MRKIPLLSLSVLCLISGCSKPNYNSELPFSTTLGSPRGYRIARTLVHMHSPYSYDACDKNGTPGGVPDPTCLANLRAALCKNKIDFTFLTDHPDNMGLYEFETLLLKAGNDEIITQGALPVANRMQDCGNGHRPMTSVGFEYNLMPLGMIQHLDPTPATRLTLYSGEDAALVNNLKTTADSVLFLPHPEKRTVDEIFNINPHGIEIFNIHAILDPKIRKRDLALPPFEQVANILSYLIDPYKETNPDFMFMEFLYIHPQYFEKWQTLINRGLKAVIAGGSDAHENVFKQKGSDGERLDGYRRLTRMMSNHYLVSSVDFTSVKDAVKAGRGWVVFEGLGSPVGMDFYATTGGSTIGVGETGAMVGGSATITVKRPTLHPESPGYKDRLPRVRILLYQVNANNQADLVASSMNSDLVFNTTSTGVYRAQVLIMPLQLKEFLGPFSEDSRGEYPWIITNAIYLQ